MLLTVAHRLTVSKFDAHGVYEAESKPIGPGPTLVDVYEVHGSRSPISTERLPSILKRTSTSRCTVPTVWVIGSDGDVSFKSILNSDSCS